MVNRYDVPAQQATGQEYYKLPINEMLGVLANKQKLQDEAVQKNTEQEAFLANLQNGYRTAGLPQEIQAEYNPILQNFIGQDMTNSDNKKQFYQTVSKIKSDPRLRTLYADVKESALWDKYRESNPKEAGVAANPYYNGKSWDLAKTQNGEWMNEKGVEGWFSNITPYADYQKSIDEAYSKVKSNTIQTLKDQGISVEYDDEGNPFYFKNASKTTREYITPDLPQWKSALEEQVASFQREDTPESKFFMAKNPQAVQDPNYLRDVISTSGGKYVYQKKVDDDVSKALGKSKAGTDKAKEVKMTSPFTITQILKENKSLAGNTLPQDIIKTTQSLVDKDIKTFAANKYTTTTNTDGYNIIQIPDGASIDEINLINSKNNEFVNKQQDIKNYKDIHNYLSDKYGFDPNVDITTQVGDEIYKKALQNKKRALDSYFDPVSGGYRTPDPKEGDKAFYDTLKGNKNFESYMKDLQAISEGITESGGLAYPLVDDKFNDVNVGILNQLSNDANYFDGNVGGIEYLQSNEAIKDDDKKYITKYLKDKGLGGLRGQTSLFWDREKGEYAALVSLPKENGVGNIQIKINSQLLPSIATESQILDPLYNQTSRQLFREDYENYADITDNVHGMVKGVGKGIVTTHVLTNENTPQGPLKPGDIIFTLPDAPNMIMKAGQFDKLYDFMTLYEANPGLQGQDLLTLLQSNGITPINSTGLYNRYKQPLKDFNPKQ
jgi:hypothetical protein